MELKTLLCDMCTKAIRVLQNWPRDQWCGVWLKSHCSLPRPNVQLSWVLGMPDIDTHGLIWSFFEPALNISTWGRMSVLFFYTTHLPVIHHCRAQTSDMADSLQSTSFWQCRFTCTCSVVRNHISSCLSCSFLAVHQVVDEGVTIPRHTLLAAELTHWTPEGVDGWFCDVAELEAGHGTSSTVTAVCTIVCEVCWNLLILKPIYSFETYRGGCCSQPWVAITGDPIRLTCNNIYPFR